MDLVLIQGGNAVSTQSLYNYCSCSYRYPTDVVGDVSNGDCEGSDYGRWRHHLVRRELRNLALTRCLCLPLSALSST